MNIFKSTVYIFILLISSIFNQEVVMGLGAVTDSSAEVTMDTPFDVGSFQFDAVGASLISGEGGLAADAGFNVSAGGETVLGFSFTGGFIPAGSSGVLTNLSGTMPTDLCLSLGTGAISDVSGITMDYTFGEFDCSYVEGCTNESACNFNDNATIDDGSCVFAEENFDCDGNCIEEIDCTGVCGGNAIEDCNGECDGGLVFDTCGICGGDDECEGVYFYFENIDFENYSFDVFMNTDVEVAGFQFQFKEINVTEIILSEEFYLEQTNVNSNTIIGVGLNNQTIFPQNNLNMFKVNFSDTSETCFYISEEGENIIADDIQNDCNMDGFIDVYDLIEMENYFYNGGSISCDANNDGIINILDYITILNTIYDTSNSPLLVSNRQGQSVLAYVDSGADINDNNICDYNEECVYGYDNCGVCNGNNDCNGVELYFENVDFDNGTVDVVIETDIEIAGFQFDLPNGIGAEGGVENDGWTNNINNGNFVGFSFTGEVLEPGTHLLSTISFEISETPYDDCLFIKSDNDAVEMNEGDCNLDNYLNVQDIVLYVQDILGNIDLGECGDTNGDSYINVQDIVLAINYVIYIDSTPLVFSDINGNSIITNNQTDSDEYVDECGVCNGDGGCLHYLSYGSWNENIGSLEILVSTGTHDLSGFQFDVSGLDLYSASGGLAEEAGFTVSTGGETVLGFTFTGSFIPAGSVGVLTTIYGYNNNSIESCLSDVIMSDNYGSFIEEYEIGDCIIVGEVVEGCIDESACNFDEAANTDDGSCAYPEENFNCDGSCAVEEDCTGECGGDAIIDECGVCEGDNTSCFNVVYFGAVTESDAGNSMEIWLSAVNDVAGFMFEVTGININDASGGIEDLGWTVSFNESGTILGFSLAGDVLAQGEHLLTVLDFDFADTEACLTFENDGALADSIGNILPSATGDCYIFTSVVAGCTDDMACNYDDSANYDDGSCTYPEENFDCEGNFIATQVQIIHNSASPTVDVYLNGELAIPGFEYRTATPVLVLPTNFMVGIAPADGEVIAEFPFTLEEGGSYAVVATGLLGNEDTPFGLAATSTTFGASDNGLVGLEVYHGSTDAPPVDVLVIDDATNQVVFSNLYYREFSGFAEVPAADYTLGIAPTGGDSIAAFLAPLSGLGGESVIIFASGFLASNDDDPEFGLFAALADGSVLELPALLQDCSGTWGGDDYIVCEDGSEVCDEAYCPISNAVTIEFGEVSDSSLEITYNSNTDIAGFQFAVSNVNLVYAEGGEAEDAGFTVSVGPTTGIVVGLALDGSTIPAGAGTLTNLGIESPDSSTESCLSDIIISDQTGLAIDVVVGDCVWIYSGSSDIVLSLGSISEEELEIYIQTLVDIGGFQFDINGSELFEGSGGVAAEAGFEVYASGEMVLGFSLSGDVIPAGTNGLLTVLQGSFDVSDVCLPFVEGVGPEENTPIFSDTFGNLIEDINIGNGLCQDDDCDGEYDECGVCNGDGSSCSDVILIGFGDTFYDEYSNINSVNITINTSYDLAGFQFNINGADLSNPNGGIAQDSGFIVQAQDQTILGFSLSGDVIPGGSNGILTNVQLNPFEPYLEFDLGDGGFVDSNGEFLNYEFGEPLFICNEGDWDDDGICDDFDECIGEYDDCGICNGNNQDIDCNGDCFGDAYYDDCNMCVGGNTDEDENWAQDCNGDCFGEAQIDDCGVCTEGNTDIDFNAYLDDCGVCYGDGTSCIPVEVSFGETTNNSTEILIDTPHEIAGFQFMIYDNVEINNLSGGLAEDNNFEMYYDNDMIIGFSLSGDTIPAGSSGVLTNVSFETLTDQICLDFGANGAFVDLEGDEYQVNFDECQDIPQDPSYFVDLPNQTGLSDMIIIENTVGLEPGDEIGLFDNFGIIETQCDSNDFGEILVGAGLYEQNQIEITGIIGSDLCEYGYDRLLGAYPGNQIVVKVYKANLDIEYEAAVEFSMGGSWGDYISVISLLSAEPGCTDPGAENYDEFAAYDDGSCEYTQIVQIDSNKLNLISFNLDLNEFNIEDVTGNVENLLFVSNDDAEFYIPDYDVNSIGDMDAEGYYISLYGQAYTNNIEISSTLIDLSTIIDLEDHKHNLIPYLPRDVNHIENVFANYYDDILLISNDDGEYWIPSMGVASLENMVSGEAYVVIISGDDNIEFTYEDIVSDLARTNDIQYFDKLSSKPNYYHVSETGVSHPIVIENIVGQFDENDEIAVYANNKLVGAIKLTENQTKYIIPAWQKINQYGLDLDGYDYGDDIELRLWKNKTNREVIVFSSFNESKFLDQYITHGTISIGDITSSLTEFGLSKAYPNPFNPKTSFELSVPNDNHVSVKIYNLMGQIVDVIIDDYISSDIYHLTWDGNSVPSGVYLIKADNGNEISTQKIMLLK